MILRQFLHRDPVAVSYLLGCIGHGAGAVIDIHLHADHISAGRAPPTFCTRAPGPRSPSTPCGTAARFRSATSRFQCCTFLATRPSTWACWSPTVPVAPSHGSYSRDTR